MLKQARWMLKVPLHQQKFLVVSVLSNSPWLPRNFKNVQNETTKFFSVGNNFRQATMQARFLYLLRFDRN